MPTPTLATAPATDLLSLGVDCGSSKVAVAVITSAGQVLHSASALHHADLPTTAERSEQDPRAIQAVAEKLIASLPADLRARIAAIGSTGQMHGLLVHDDQPRSPLITWQDQRTIADPACLPRLPSPCPPGYGLATLAWLQHHAAIPSGARAATIHGWLAAQWCGRSAIDPTDVQAWGGAAAMAHMPTALLPDLVGHGAQIGTLAPAAAGRLGLHCGIPLSAALGDNQASLHGSLSDPHTELAFTLGTGCQLSAVMPIDQVGALAPGCEVRPFADTYVAVVVAPLAGGSAWRWLALTAQNWASDLGLKPPALETVFARLDTLGLAANDSIALRPHFSGERHDATLRASISNLCLSNGRLGEIARALARSLAATPRDLLPATAYHGRTHLVLSGNALRRSRLLRDMAALEFNLPVRLSASAEEAATGAARVAWGCVRG